MALIISKAFDGFMIACHARGLSQNTIDDYTRTLIRFIKFTGDPEMDQVRSADISAFLASCQVSNKSKRNYYIGLASFWTWASAEGITTRHIVREIKPPEPEKRIIEPFTIIEIKAIMAAISRSKVYRSVLGQIRDHALRTADRNRAIILLLLDTGIRASELTNLHLQDLDIKKNIIKVKGKGNKERLVPISSRTAQALWRYAAQRENPRAMDPVFITNSGMAMNRKDLAHRLGEIGKRAGIRRVHPHRFRHTFAITYLKNGGDIYTLQAILGHSTLDMVRTYLRLASVDIEEAHRRASPVDNWRL